MRALRKELLQLRFRIRNVAPFLLSIALSLSSARAELRIEEWDTYGAMAEQGAVCAAFARIMELQSMVDERTGQLWLERRKFSGAVVRQASILEGLDGATANEIDALVNRYSMWLINNLTTSGDATTMDPEAHEAAANMIRDICSGLYDRADTAIFERLPALKACPVTSGQDQKQCPAPQADMTNAREDKTSEAKEQITKLLRSNMKLSAELEKLKQEITRLQNAAVIGPAAASPVRPLPQALPTSKPEGIIPRMARNTIGDGISPDTEKTTKRTFNGKTDVTQRFTAQLGSYRTNAAAMAGIAMLRDQFPKELGQIDLNIESSTLQNGDTVHRLVTLGLGRSETTAICEALWGKKFGCLLKAVKQTP